MGFTTGFLGGLTATYTLLYLSLHLHRTNRTHQSLLLKQQKHLLTLLYDPPAEILESPAYEVRKVGLAEELKDRWNREVEALVRNVQDTDWEDVRLRWERRVGNAWANLRDTEAAREIETRFQENVVGAAEGVKEGVQEAAREKRLLELK